MDPGPSPEQPGRELSKSRYQHETTGEHMRIETYPPIPDRVHMLFGPEKIYIAAHSRIREGEPDHKKTEKGQRQQGQDPEQG
jgi:hypothetical protein